MASRRRRRLNRPGGASSRPSILLGDSVRTGRDLYRFASRESLLLPRSYAPAIFSARRQVLEFQNSLARMLRKPPPVVRRQVQGRLVSLRKLNRPFLKEQSSPCKRRAVRREVMFSGGVAGRRWSRGGPKMFRARRTVDSSYRCVR